jgi:ABC-type Mn2+/Zn2+ transport system permease subunit
VPNPEELAALLATLIVVTLQVVGASLRWSLKHPYPVDLRSARATPAPPAAMVGYSARLATCTTFTGLVFSGCAHVPNWRLSLIVAMPCVLWSATRLARTRRRWEDPVTRAVVVSTVAA